MAMDSRLKISVIIPTMNRPKTLERTLASYAAGKETPDQIIVVDQSETMDTRHAVESLCGHFGAEYLYRDVPSSAAARNAGQRAAKQDIVIFSDDDIDVYPDTLGNVRDIMSREGVALIAGIDDLTGVSRTNIGYLLGTKSYRKRKIGHVTASVLGRYPDQVQGEIDTEWAMGFFFVVRKSLAEEWNLEWDERLISYAYAEDLDFSWRYCSRARETGLKCVLSDRVRVRHLASREYRIPSRKSTYMYAIHRRYISDKNHIGSRLAMGWCDFWRIVERAVKRENPGELINAIKAAGRLRKSNYAGMEDVIRNA